MSFVLKQTGTAPMMQPAAGQTPESWETFQAGVTVERIEIDSWGYADRRAMDYFSELHSSIGDLYGDGPKRARSGQERLGDKVKYLTDRAAQLRENDADGRYDHLPVSVEDFNAEVTRRLRSEHDDASAVLDLGSGTSEFLGRMWAGSTDEMTLLTLPLGGAGGGILRTAVMEAGANIAGEALTLPKQYEIADRLDLPAPNPLVQLGTSAVIGAGLGGAVAGGQRYLRYRKDLHSADSQRRPDDEDQFKFTDDVNRAEQALRSARNPAEPDPSGPLPSSAPATPQAAQRFSRVAQAGKGFTVLVDEDGNAIRREGTRAWRNNNPGNIRSSDFANRHGAIGTDGAFAVFPDYETGRAAKAALLFETKSYRDLSIGQAIARYAPPTENDTASYIRSITQAVGASSVAKLASLTPSQRVKMLDAMEAVEGFRPGRENGVQASAPEGFKGYTPTRRGYTTSGTVTAGGDTRVSVDYQVVDASTLVRASGDLQPRDRSRAASDEQVAEIAAQLDPARLMPAPEADRGAPVVGPDGIIESGNGRVMALERAFENHPDRADAYRQQIETSGFSIPEGVERPVLIARRTSDLTPESRRDFVLRANQSNIARMSATERAAADASLLGRNTIGLFDPAKPLNSASNAPFVRNILDKLPQSERAALIDAQGTLNADGVQRIRQAVFAQAYNAPDILARFAETGAGDLRSLMDALEQASAKWGNMRSRIAEGDLRAEMDITPFVLDAMRLVASAREIASRDGKAFAAMVQELLDDVDLLEGATSPLTAALVRKMLPNGRMARADKIAAFLNRYADEAGKIGGIDATLFDSPGPLDALKAIDRETFGNVADIGQARVPARPPEPIANDFPAEAFADGAASPEAEIAAQSIGDDLRSQIAEFADDETLDVILEDGSIMSVREILEDLDADETLETVISLCAGKGS